MLPKIRVRKNPGSTINTLIPGAIKASSWDRHSTAPGRRTVLIAPHRDIHHVHRQTEVEGWDKR